MRKVGQNTAEQEARFTVLGPPFTLAAASRSSCTATHPLHGLLGGPGIVLTPGAGTRAAGTWPTMAYASSIGAPAKRIVITGGPGAGKTAVLEVARRDLCKHVEVLPESARIAFGGGFPRRHDDAGRRGAQRAIFHLQDELERMGSESVAAATLLCDRGTLDGLAYWPGSWHEFFEDLRTTMQQELARYALVIHLRVPDHENGYKNDVVRRESPQEAGEIDRRLVEVWAGHPHRVFVDSSVDFVRKAQRALAVIRSALTCCASKDPRHG